MASRQKKCHQLFRHCQRLYTLDNTKRRCLVFPGQGAQYVGMAKDLFDTFPFIKAFIQEADDIVGYSLSDTMFNGDIFDLTQTICAQPAVLMHSLSVLKVLQCEFGMFCGNDFEIAMGLSLGEYSALCALKCFESEQDAVYLVDKRARAMNECCADTKNEKSEQRMLAIMHDGSLTVDCLQQMIDCLKKNEFVCDIANLNGPRQIVVSGHKLALDELQCALKNKKRIKSKYLNTGGAFHSFLMFDAKKKLKETLENIEISLPQKGHFLISNVDATPITNNESEPQIIKKMLCNQVCAPVCWYPSVLRCIEEFGISEFVEIGPKASICAMIRDICKQHNIDNVNAINFDTLSDLTQVK